MDVDSILQRHVDTLRQWRRRLDGYSPDAFQASPGDGRWSAAQVYEHVYQVQRTLLESARACAEGRGETGRSGLGPAIFSWMGSFPPIPIRVKKIPPGLEAVYRPAQISKEQAAARLGEMEAEMRAMAEAVKGAPRDRRLRHWAGGWFNAAQWFHSAEMHLRHHSRQLDRIDRLLGASRPATKAADLSS